MKLPRRTLLPSLALPVLALVALGATPPPPLAPPKALLVSDFEDGQATVLTGIGWLPSTDRMPDSGSRVDLTVEKPGVLGSRYALHIRGRVAEGMAMGFAGAMYYPGKVAREAIDLSAYRAITFAAKGDGKPYSLLLFTKSGGENPKSAGFVPTAEWEKHSFRFAAAGIDGHDITGVFIGGGPGTGDVWLDIDDVQFE